MNTTVQMTSIADATISQSVGGPPPEFIAFMVFWGILGLSSFLFFHFNHNATLKRNVFPVFIILIGVIFGGFVYYIMGRQHPQVLLPLVPALIVISFLNIRTTRFCDACGKTLYRQPIFTRTQYCSHCGSELK